MPKIPRWCPLLFVFSTSSNGFAQPPVHRSCEPALAEVSATANDLKAVEPLDLPHSKILFETSFEVRSGGEDSAWDLVVRHAERWASALTSLSGAEKESARRALVDLQGEDFRQILLRNDRVKMVFVNQDSARGERRHWAMLVEHPDHRDRKATWRVDFGMTAQGPGKVHLALTVSISHVRAAGLRQVREIDTVPVLVRKILEDSRLAASTGSMPLATTAFQLTPETTADLERAIHDPNRSLPLILVSRDLVTGAPTFEVDELAKRLRGFATVILELPLELTTPHFRRSLGPLLPHSGGLKIVGPNGALEGEYFRPGGVSDQDVIERVARLVRRKSLGWVRASRQGLVNSIFDLDI